MHHDDKSSFASDEIDEELEEGVDSESLQLLARFASTKPDLFVLASYMSLMGSTQNATFSEMILAHDDIE